MDISSNFKKLAAMLQMEGPEITIDQKAKNLEIEHLCLSILKASDNAFNQLDIISLQAKLHLLNQDMADKIFNKLVTVASGSNSGIFRNISKKTWENYSSLCQLLPISQQNDALLEKMHKQLLGMTSAQFDELHAFFKSVPESERLTFFKKFSDLPESSAKEKLAILTEHLFASKILDVSGTSLSDTDLVVFKDDYKGQMPINGIKESDYQKTCALFEKISKNETALSIIGEADLSKPLQKPMPGNEQATPGYTAILSAIKSLLTRELGRKLLTKLAEQKQEVLLLHNSTPSCYGMCEVLKDAATKARLPRVNLSSAPANAHAFEQTPLGVKMRLTPELPHVTLAHELIHFSHFLADRASFLFKRQPPTLGPHYSELEEQITITGFANEPPVKETLTDEEFEKACQDLAFDTPDYEEINERSITVAFTDAQHIFYPREGHTAIGHIDMKMLNRPDGLYSLQNLLCALVNAESPLMLVETIHQAKEILTGSSFINQDALAQLLYPFEDQLQKAYEHAEHPWHQEIHTYIKNLERVQKNAQ